MSTRPKTIEEWREAKAQADKDASYRSQLGCVGEPISDAFDRVLQGFVDVADRDRAERLLNDAAETARGNLLDYANDQRQQGADEIMGDLECAVSFDSYNIELDVSDTLADVAERGFDSCLAQITSQCWLVCTITDEAL